MLKHAFGLLASAETGRWQAYRGKDLEPLRTRVALLAVLGDVLPRQDVPRLRVILEAWKSRFRTASTVSFGELRGEAFAALQASRKAVKKESQVASGAKRNAKQERRCDAILDQWRKQLLENPAWMFLPAVVPGEPPTPIDQVFVELFAIADQQGAIALEFATEPAPTSRRRLAADYPVVSVTSMVARTLEQCVVVGPPGSGKSTLMHWLARAVAKGEVSDFDAALVVKLSAYADALTNDASLSPLEFFVKSLDPDGGNWKQEADWLRRRSQATRRYLLLLDGWDEVAVGARAAVLRAVQNEQPCFVTVITSRPSGLPRQLSGVVNTDFYRMAGLAPRAIQQLIRNLLLTNNRLDLAEEIQRRVEEELDLREMAENPFLLGLLVRVLARCEGEAPRTMAAIYDQIAAWMHQQHSEATGKKQRLASHHFLGLQRLSHDLLFRRRDSSYLFCWRELVEAMGGRSPEAVLRSRFVNRTHPVFDEHRFLHATFQEYFAALYAKNLDEIDFEPFAARAFASASRLIVLEFLAGLPGEKSLRLEALATQWLNTPDRFHQVLLRTARLVAAARWQERALGSRVRDELWRVISENEDMALTQRAIEAYSALDPLELCRRVKGASGFDSWALNCMLEAIPASVARRGEIVDLLPGKWRDYAGIELRSEVTQEQIAAMRRVLASRKTSLQRRREAITFAGAVRDTGATSALIDVLQDQSLPLALREDVIDSVAAIASRRAVDALVEVVTGEIPLSPEGSRAAAAALRNTTVGRKALDPEGRDRLLRRLALVAPEHSHVLCILTALEGHPIRDGSELIGKFVQDKSLPDEVRQQAAVALATAADRDVIARAAAGIEHESSRAVASALLDLAVQRRLDVPLRWLQSRIVEMGDRVALRQLLKQFVRAISRASDQVRDEALTFLHALIAKSLEASEREEGNELSKALLSALSSGTPGERPSLRRETLELAMRCLEQYVEDQESVAEGAVLLSIAVAQHFGDAGAGPLLRQALDAALHSQRAQPPPRRQRDRIASMAVNGLAHISPRELLCYPDDCEPVKAALRAASVERGWLVYSHRIDDAEGGEIARLDILPDADSEMEETPAASSCETAPPIRVGAESKKTINSLKLFYKIGLEYERGAYSLSEIGRRIEAQDLDLPYSKSALSKTCDDVQGFFDKHDKTSAPLFLGGQTGASQTGLSPAGKAAWRRTEALLRYLGIVVD